MLLALALAAGGAVLVAPTASAATAPKVTITSAPTVTGTSVSVGFTVNRQTKSVASCTYTLDGGVTNTPCGAPTSAPKVNPATYSVTATNLTDGVYTLTVNVTLTDRGTASASSTSFIIVLHTAARVACAELGGTFEQDAYVGVRRYLWSCSGPLVTIQDSSRSSTGALYIACRDESRPGAVQWGFSYAFPTPFTVTAFCTA